VTIANREISNQLIEIEINKPKEVDEKPIMIHRTSKFSRIGENGDRCLDCSS
jgi:enolase